MYCNTIGGVATSNNYGYILHNSYTSFKTITFPYSNYILITIVMYHLDSASGYVSALYKLGIKDINYGSPLFDSETSAYLNIRNSTNTSIELGFELIGNRNMTKAKITYITFT